MVLAAWCSEHSALLDGRNWKKSAAACTLHSSDMKSIYIYNILHIEL